MNLEVGAAGVAATSSATPAGFASGIVSSSFSACAGGSSTCLLVLDFDFDFDFEVWTD